MGCGDAVAEEARQLQAQALEVLTSDSVNALGLLREVEKVAPKLKGLKHQIIIAEILCVQQDAQFTDWFSVLGLDPTLEVVPSKAVLQKAFRQRALHCHPDKCPEVHDAAEAVFKLVTQALDVLTDPEKAPAFAKARREEVHRRQQLAAAAAAEAAQREAAAAAAAAQAAAAHAAQQPGFGGFFRGFVETPPPRSVFAGFAWSNATNLGYHTLSEATKPHDVAGTIKCAFCPTRFLYQMQDHYAMVQQRPCVFTCQGCKRGNVVHQSTAAPSMSAGHGLHPRTPAASAATAPEDMMTTPPPTASTPKAQNTAGRRHVPQPSGSKKRKASPSTAAASESKRAHADAKEASSRKSTAGPRSFSFDDTKKAPSRLTPRRPQEKRKHAEEQAGPSAKRQRAAPGTAHPTSEVAHTETLSVEEEMMDSTPCKAALQRAASLGRRKVVPGAGVAAQKTRLGASSTNASSAQPRKLARKRASGVPDGNAAGCSVSGAKRKPEEIPEGTDKENMHHNTPVTGGGGAPKRLKQSTIDFSKFFSQ